MASPRSQARPSDARRPRGRASPTPAAGGPGDPAAGNELQPRSAARAGQRPFQAFGAARTLWGSKAEEIVIEGPAGTGKTRACLEKCHLIAMKYDGCRILLVRKTRESMTESVLVTFEEKVVPDGSPILAGPRRNLRAAYHYPNGSEIVVGGMDKSSRIMSTEYDIVVVFEATEISEEEFEALTTRLRNGVVPYQQIIVDCNPERPSHWINRRAETGKMLRLRSKHSDNPVYFDMKLQDWTPFGKSYREKLARLTGARRLRLFEGKWAASEGLVYDEWDPDLHLIDWDQLPGRMIPPEWRRIRSIDFGFRNSFVCQWWAIDGDGRMYLYRELYMPGRTVAEHAPTIKKWSEGETYEATVADHDAEDRATLEREGIVTKPAFKDITPGIEAVQNRLKKDKTERPRLFIIRGCLIERSDELAEQHAPVCTADEFDNYVWAKDQDGKNRKEEPVKKDDHGMDAMKYAVAEVDDLRAMVIRITGASMKAVYATAGQQPGMRDMYGRR